jgi:Fe-S-cluster containining protein
MNDAPNGELSELERQVEQGGLHTHSALSRLADRLNRIEAFVYGVADTLLAKGAIGEDEVRAQAERVATELQGQQETVSAGIVLRVDEDQPPADVAVDCAARMHICHAVCCRLTFALSADEIEAGAARWELGRPYLIRKDANGACVHRGCDGCGIYANRPRVCRTYSCARDGRIWTDFERMILNEQWIAENLRPERPYLVAARMSPID